MTAATQSFWFQFYAWSLGLGFVLAIIFGAMTYDLIREKRFRNPFAPFIRMVERRQEHKHYLQKMEARAALVKTGMDPDYVRHLERELKK